MADALDRIREAAERAWQSYEARGHAGLPEPDVELHGQGDEIAADATPDEVLPPKRKGFDGKDLGHSDGLPNGDAGAASGGV